ncbi:cell wall hydrolase [Sphingomonas aerolata]|uniref:cell wall hydrolase n=1 Tax=Sphingomonas aerolata TaxID=185951 RepID=UPI002FE0E43C
MTDARGAVYLRVSVLAIAAAAIVGPTLVVTNPPALPHPARAAMPKQRVVPQAELPPVEPVRFVDLAPEDARAFNATVPFSTDPNPAARPFRFAGTADDLARATDCLAAGTLYEAGDDTVGERAVAQVVLNRLRHPAFPKTVCGVVFEGETRATGCQFSFSCDGALLRWKPSEDAWRRARSVAAAALSGNVYRPVGYATHYHTDWVVPYWQSSLDKIVAVGSHLFFRWSGWWGTPRPSDVRPSRANRSSRSSRLFRMRTAPPPRCPKPMPRLPKHPPRSASCWATMRSPVTARTRPRRPLPRPRAILC